MESSSSQIHSAEAHEALTISRHMVEKRVLFGFRCTSTLNKMAVARRVVHIAVLRDWQQPGKEERS